MEADPIFRINLVEEEKKSSVESSLSSSKVTMRLTCSDQLGR